MDIIQIIYNRQKNSFSICLKCRSCHKTKVIELESTNKQKIKNMEYFNVNSVNMKCPDINCWMRTFF